MITLQNGKLLRQSGYIIAPDLSPKKSELQRKMRGGGEEELWGWGDITTETEGRNPPCKFELRRC